jgi:hypothetical protein
MQIRSGRSVPVNWHDLNMTLRARTLASAVALAMAAASPLFGRAPVIDTRNSSVAVQPRIASGARGARKYERSLFSRKSYLGRASGLARKLIRAGEGVGGYKPYGWHP